MQGDVPNNLSRAIMAPRDVILDTAEAQRLALFFDHILTWPLDRKARDQDEAKRLQAELEFLAAEKVVLRCGLQIPPLFSFTTHDGKVWDPLGQFAKNCELVVPFQLVAGVPKAPATETDIDRTVRHISKQLIYADAPVTVHLPTENLPTVDGAMRAVELTLKRVPMPPANMPWADLIQFRNDPEMKSLLRKLRLWLQEQVRSVRSPREMEEQLESLLEDYRKYMALHHRKVGEGVLSTVLVATTDALTELLNLKPGDALRALLDIHGRKIELTEAELAAPGREVSYIAKTQDFVQSMG